MIESAEAGSATIMAGLAVDAVRRGHEVHVIYSPGREDPKIVERLRAGGCATVVPCTMRRSIGPWDALDGMRLRRSLSRLGKLDVIHSHSSKAGALSRIFARVASAVQIYSPHGFYTMTGEAPFYIGPVERGLSLLSDRIIAVSAFERRHALNLGISGDRVVVVPNGIAPYRPLPRDQARAALGLDPSDFIVGFVGRLAEQKDPVEALRVIDALPPSASARLALIGDGELRATAEQYAEDHCSRATFLGSRDAKLLFSAFDCVLCTSRYEGMPVSFLEALNCGVPIVSYPVGGTEELVIDGRTGFASPAEPFAAAQAVARLAAMKPQEKERIAQSCRKLAGQHSDGAMSARTLAVYESALRGRT